MIVETILARLLDPQAARAPPPRPRRTRLTAEINFSRRRILRAPPTLDEAREYMAEMTGIEVPEDHQQPFGAWVMDCLIMEADVRAGGKATVQYIVVLNCVYRRVAMVAAGAATAPHRTPYTGTGTWTPATPTISESATSMGPSPGCGFSSRGTTGFSISCA